MTEVEIDALQESIRKLEENNKRLTAELKTARKNAEITPEQLASVEAERDKAIAELTTLQKSSKDLAKSLETAQEQLKDESGFTQKLLVDNGLSDALVKNGVAPHFLPAVKAMFAGQAQVVTDGDNRVAKIGDKALHDAIKEWSASDEGKHFVLAPGNTGGGAAGGGGGQNRKQMAWAEFNNLGQAERAAFFKGGGQVTD